MAASPFSPEHDTLRGAVRRFAEDRSPREPGELRRAAVALGYLDADLDMLAALVVAEELGRAGALDVALDLLDAGHGAAALAEVGQQRCALAVASLVDVSERDDVVHLSGSTWPSLAAPGAAAILVLVEGQQAGFLVPADSGGVEVRALHTGPGWDALGVGEVALADVEVPAEARIPLAPEVLRRQRERFAVLAAAAVTACAWNEWERAKDYAGTREAFGRPIGRFQVNRHALARAATALTAATQLARDAAVALDAGGSAPVWAALRYALTAAVDVTDRCLQLHGGAGYTMELATQRAWRDVRSARLVLGPGADHATPTRRTA